MTQRRKGQEAYKHKGPKTQQGLKKSFIRGSIGYTYNSYPPSLTAAPTTMFFLHNLFLCSLMHERKCKLSKKFRYFGSRQQRWCLYLTTKREMVVIEGQ